MRAGTHLDKIGPARGDSFNDSIIYIYNIYIYIYIYEGLCPLLLAPPLPPTSIFAYPFNAYMGAGLICYTELDSRRNLAAECMSQKLICSILRFHVFIISC